MATQTNNPQAIIPDIPRDTKVIDKNTGEMSSSWYLFFQQLILALQSSLSNEGFVIPRLSAANIALLGNNTQSVGSIMYDSTNDEFKGIVLVDIGPPVVTQTKTFTVT
jgi:hypothetical protein